MASWRVSSMLVMMGLVLMASLCVTAASLSSDGAAHEHASLSLADTAPKHIAVATLHSIGHLVPFMALAKELKTRYPSTRVSFIVSGFGVSTAERQMVPLGVEVISMGSPPWTYEEDLKLMAEIFAKPMLEILPSLMSMLFEVERSGTKHLIDALRDPVNRPDFLVIDPVVGAVINVADYYGIPYMYLHTSGLPLIDSWKSFFVRKPVHIPWQIMPPMGDIVNSPIKRLIVAAADLLGDQLIGRVLIYIHNQIRAEYGIATSPGFVRSNALPTPILISTAWGFTEATSLPPFVQLIGSVFDPEISPAPTITPELQQWLDQSDNPPVVYISTGTNAKLTDEQLQSLAGAFNALEQYRFLWSLRKEKYSTDIPCLKAHVRMENFVPQATVLAHPSVKVFLSHCGQNSMLEAVWSRVPVLALPFSADQPGNARSLVSNGAALQLPSTNITTEIVAESLQRLMHDKSFVHNMNRLAMVLEVAGGREKAAQWVWLIANHGASYLIPKELEVGWFLYYELDVWLAKLAAVALVLVGCWIAVRVLRCCLCRSRKGSAKVKAE